MSDVAKVKLPFEETARSSAPLLRSTSPLPLRPLTVPPTVYLGGGLVTQLTETLVTLVPATVPEAFETVQVCPEGWAATVTAYVFPLVSDVAKVKLPFEETARSSAPLSCGARARFH